MLKSLIILVVLLISSAKSLTFKFSEEDLEQLKVKINKATSGQLNLLEDNELSAIISTKPVQNPKNIFAVLVAGSNGYYNYRHQVKEIVKEKILCSHNLIFFNGFSMLG